MQVLLPIGLLALLALPLIVVLHMVRERRKRMVVPGVQHWRNLPRPKAGQRFTHLPLTLLLLLQLLIAGLLALALARPQLLGGLMRRTAQTAIVLDTSTSMAARDGGQTRLDQARAEALGVVNNVAAGDRVILIDGGSAPRVLASGGENDRAGLQAVLNALRPGGTVADIDTAVSLAEASLDQNIPGRILVLTDGSSARPADRASVAPVEWRQLGGSPANRAIIAFAARPAGGKTQVYARVANYGGGSFDGTMQLFVDEQLIDARPVSIAANAEAEQTWTLPAGGSALRLALDSNDALSEDDQAFVSLASTRSLNITLVTAEAEPLRRALAAVPGVTVTVRDASSYEAYAASNPADVTVFDNYLPQSWPSGAALVVQPPTGNGLLSVTGSIGEREQGELVQRGALVAGLGFGGVKFDTVSSLETPAWGQVLLSEGELPLIIRGRDGEHEVAIWTFDVHDSTISTRLAFPLLIARTVRDLAPSALPVSIEAGAALHWRPSARATSIDLVSPSGATKQLAIGTNVATEDLTEPGWYSVVERDATGELFRGRVAVNAGTPLESDLRQDAPPVFNTNTSPQTGASARQATDLWPLLALAAFMALAGEWLYTHRRVTR